MNEGWSPVLIRSVWGEGEAAKTTPDRGLEAVPLLSYGGPVKNRVLQPGYHRGRVPPNKGKKYPVEILTPDEVRQLAAQCSTTSSRGIRARAIIVLLYRTGMRISEALEVRAKDVDLEAGSVAVLHGKGGRQRTVGIDPGAYEHIDAWIKRRESVGISDPVPLLCTLQGRPMSGSSVRAMFRRLGQRAGIEKRVHPHGLRHTHAYELMMEGISMPIIQQQLGHVSLETTDIYLAHIAPKQVIETMRNREWSP